MTDAIQLEPTRVREALVRWHGLDRIHHPQGAEGLRALLARRTCIQLDPLSPVATNADLVALARVDGLRVGDVYRHLMPGHAFDHFAKERCILPASAFAHYRDQAVRTPWWRLGSRMERVSPEVIAAVLDEVGRRGPITPEELTDRGRVQQLDWSGWKGTPRAVTMALEVLWTRCQVVVHSRVGKRKRYSLPAASLGTAAAAPPRGDFSRWALLERVRAAGLLARAGGPMWSMLHDVRRSALPDALVAEGAVLQVTVRGSRRPYLCLPELLEQAPPEYDERMRPLGPLDSLIWDRKLVKHLWGFEYIWEVYKPAAKRRWGWYVMPLLHRGRLVGRFEGRAVDGALRVDRVWEEVGYAAAAFDAMGARMESAL